MKTLRYLMLLALLLAPSLAQAAGISMLFSPEWKEKADQANGIAAALSKDSGLEIKAVITKNYPEIIKAFAGNEPMITYAGSFVQAVLLKRGLSVPLLQGVDGKEMYYSVMIAPKSAGNAPQAIVSQAGEELSYAAGASSGESGAKAASLGKAARPVYNHLAAVNAIKTGRIMSAQAAFVKSWWWEAHKNEFPDMQRLDYPGVSDKPNPDNILSANKVVTSEMAEKIKAAALQNASAFSVTSLRPVTPAIFDGTLALMEMGKIDPLTYSWDK